MSHRAFEVVRPGHVSVRSAAPYRHGMEPADTTPPPGACTRISTQTASPQPSSLRRPPPWRWFTALHRVLGLPPPGRSDLARQHQARPRRCPTHTLGTRPDLRSEHLGSAVPEGHAHLRRCRRQRAAGQLKSTQCPADVTQFLIAGGPPSRHTVASVVAPALRTLISIWGPQASLQRYDPRPERSRRPAPHPAQRIGSSAHGHAVHPSATVRSTLT